MLRYISHVRLAAVPVAVAVLLAGCGGSSKPRLTVAAAASLTEALTACTKDYAAADVRLSFGGSDAIAAQIRQGVKPDVFASANTSLPDALHAEGLADPPQPFAANRLVLAVPTGTTSVETLDDLARPGLRIAVGSPSVPVGSYTAKVLAKLPTTLRDAIERATRTREPDVKGIVGKLTEGAVDAGFVYVTDVEATGGRLRAIELPADASPVIAYAAVLVHGSKQADAGREFLTGLRHGACARALRRAGFLPPP